MPYSLHRKVNQPDTPKKNAFWRSQTDSNTLHTLEGERSAPQVNCSKFGLPRTGMAVFLFGLLLCLLAFTHYIYRKHLPKPADIAKANEPSTLQSVIPSRSFNRPIPAVVASVSTPIAPMEKQAALKTAYSVDKPLLSSQLAFPFPLPLPIQPPIVSVASEQKKPLKEPVILDKSNSSLMTSPISDIANLSVSQLTGKHDMAQVISRVQSIDTMPSIEPSQITQEDKSRHLENLLQSTATSMRHARHIGNRNFIASKGTLINCVLQTKLDTSVAGMTRCGVSHNVYSDNGKVVLIERGSTLSGEYQAGLDQGIKRVFVLWNRLKTPNGIVIDLDSPATDSLGATGVPGRIDTHFWTRFGGAIAMSFINDTGKTISALASKEKQVGATIHIGDASQSGQDIVTETLKRTINIAPTLHQNHGEVVGVYLARDLDFSGVYDVIAE